MSFQWKTSDMVTALQAACPNAKIHNIGPGGDYDTDTLIVEVDAGSIFVSGYTPKLVMANPSLADVTHVTVGDGLDSRGGLTSSEPSVVQAYCNVRTSLAAMLNTTDVSIYNHYNEFF